MFGEFYVPGGGAFPAELEATTAAFASDPSLSCRKDDVMAWSTPVLIEICIGLEINGYLPAEL